MLQTFYERVTQNTRRANWTNKFVTMPEHIIENKITRFIPVDEYTIIIFGGYDNKSKTCIVIFRVTDRSRLIGTSIGDLRGQANESDFQPGCANSSASFR